MYGSELAGKDRVGTNANSIDDTVLRMVCTQDKSLFKNAKSNIDKSVLPSWCALISQCKVYVHRF